MNSNPNPNSITRERATRVFSGWLMLEIKCADGDRAAQLRRALERTVELLQPPSTA